MSTLSARRLVIDVLAPVVALALAIYLPLTDRLTAESLPLIFGLFGLPLASRPPTLTPAAPPPGSPDAEQQAP